MDDEICYGNGHQHHFNSPQNKHSEREALEYALELLREDARGNIDLEHKTVDPDDSESEEEEESDNDDLHDSDSDDPNDLGNYERASFSDDEEDYCEGNNHGNPDT